eukprot:TRINITY_DN8504_c0_g2_i2.p1 TRINITY_DN8504_c0_g2~~TRINITY_DN8504_c0_g2_i2.p1  ORF type:complete len:373 (+),score=73.78 TRINITY_DN8504_c0_g2_i2:498-1616(+)
MGSDTSEKRVGVEEGLKRRKIESLLVGKGEPTVKKVEKPKFVPISAADFFAQNIRQLNEKIAKKGPMENIARSPVSMKESSDNTMNDVLPSNQPEPIQSDIEERRNEDTEDHHYAGKKMEIHSSMVISDNINDKKQSILEKKTLEPTVKQATNKEVAVNVAKPAVVKQSIIQINKPIPKTDTKIMIAETAGCMWADKYAPKAFSGFVGNSDIIDALRIWMRDWEGAVLRGHRKKTDFVKGRLNPNAKACLLSGPPGIGKSTAARLVAGEFGYEVLETNASDQRSKKVINELLADTVNNRSICLYADNATSKKVAVIMDEIDGVSGTNDKGGIAALIKIINATKIPIICICNDRQSPKVRSLAFHCYDLKFLR